jgi:MFS family permease
VTEPPAAAEPVVVEPPPPAAGHHGSFPGWRVVAASFATLCITSGLGFYGLAVYLNSFANERGWEVSSISRATTLFFVVAGFTGLLAARLMATRDVRAVVVAGAVLGAIALALLGRVEQRWQLYAVYSLFAVGFALAGLVPATTVVTRWFHVKRSTALSIASTGLSVGGVLVTPLAKYLLDTHGLRTITPVLAVVWLVGIVPMTVLFLLPDPARAGWMPDGERIDVTAAAPVPGGMPWAQARRHRFFLATMAGYVLLLGSQVGGIQQLVKLVEERTDRGAATFATAVLAVMSVIGRLVGGQVVRRVSMTAVLLVLAAGQAVTLALLAVLHDRVALFVTIGVLGITVGNILMLQPLLLAERFGVRDYPRIYSRSSFVTMFGTAAGPLLLGELHDGAGGYRTSYLAAAGCALVGALVLSTAGSAEYSET